MPFGSLGLGLGLGAQSRAAQKDMILVYEIPDPNTDIELAIQANSTYFSAGQSVVISWGDGSANEPVSDTGGSTYIGHTYTAAGTYKVKISGSMTMYGRSSGVDIAGQAYLTRVDSFGKLGITSFRFAFYKCTGLMSVPKTLPDSVTSMQDTFRNCYGDGFNPDVSKWDVSEVRCMSAMFNNCSGAGFNPDVSNWNVSKVTSMKGMFQNCSHANFKGGRGVDGLGRGIANWKPKSLSTGATKGLSDFMLGAQAQDAAYLDSILNAWAALIGDPVNPLPANITATFPANQPYNGSVSGAALTALAAHGWAISTLIDTGN